MEQWVKKDNENVVVEAVRVNEDNVKDLALWCGGELIQEIDPEHPDEGKEQYGINLRTPGGMKRASLHQYVVKFGRDFFVQDNRIFETKYKPANRPAPPLESAGDTRKRLGFGGDPATGMMI